MTLSLDSNVAIDLLRGRDLAVRERFMRRVADEAPIHVSVIVLHELMYGAERSARSAEHRAMVGFLLRDMTIEPLSESDALAAARTRARLGREGRPIGPYDVLIAGQALNRGWTLATSKVREFERVEGLRIEDWTRPAP